MSPVPVVRLVIGLGCVAAGVSLAAPVATRLWDAMRAEIEPVGATTAACPAAGGATAGIRDATARDGDRATRAAEGAPPSRPSAPQPSREQARENPGGTARAVPPAPAAPVASGGPLPVWAAGWEVAPPRLGPTYRSAFDEPPPPLLDGADPRSPPNAPRRAAVHQGVAGAATGFAPALGDVAADPAAIVPAVDSAGYRIRDGDDLAGIAARIYGDPNAAQAIWAANRDLVPDPALLPIGARLRLPAQWQVLGGMGRGIAIEPRSAGSP